MVLDSLKNASAYAALNPLFQQAFDFIATHDLASMEPGKTILEGDKLYVSVMEIEGKTPEAAKMETHQKYIDIQVVISGEETMGWTAVENCTHAMDAYNPEKDIQFFTDKPTASVTVHPGEFAIFWPGDGHAPAMGQGPIKKAVFKVLV